jgi:uncharacterized membrane protein
VSRNAGKQRICDVCGRSFSSKELISGHLVRSSISELIQRDHPAWSEEGFICRADLGSYRGRYVESLLESEKGEMTSLEEEVLRSLREHEVLTTDVDAEFEQEWTLGERLADRLAGFGGSWTFLVLFGVFIVCWVGVNTGLLYFHPLDPYPFLLLNLVLSCIAAVQAPVIMMSQNRQEAKDRRRSQHDYQVNLKAELEIRQLHEKLDHLLLHQWERLVEIQQVQLELLDELGRAR